MTMMKEPMGGLVCLLARATRNGCLWKMTTRGQRRYCPSMFRVDDQTDSLEGNLVNGELNNPSIITHHDRLHWPRATTSAGSSR